MSRPNAHERGYCSQGWKAARREVLLRDNYQCKVCGAVVHGKRAHVDHIVPKAQGGSDEVSNLRTLCVSCHSKHEGWRAANERRRAAKVTRPI